MQSLRVSISARQRLQFFGQDAARRRPPAMGMWNTTVAAEISELREEILRTMAAPCCGASARKRSPGGGARRRTDPRGVTRPEDEEVCVTGGLSFLASAIAFRLLDCGCAVRLVVASREEQEKVAEMGADATLRTVVAEATDAEGLRRAFDGCAAVFHTSAAVDPSGLSGYSKQMADLEVRAAERVMEACVRAESVKKCVFTSSLSACVWRPDGRRRRAAVDESCWSDEDLCREKKLWFALGKTMAEKAAWKIAQGRRDLELVTVCPALLTGPGFVPRNSTASIASLKGARELLAEGLLATADAEAVAAAHVKIYESMTTSGSAGGRYICFDHLIRRPEEVDELEQLLGIGRRRNSAETTTRTATQFHQPQPGISKQKLSRLLMATNSVRRCTYDVCSYLT